MLNRGIVGGITEQVGLGIGLLLFTNTRFQGGKSSVVNDGYSSFNIISSTRGAVEVVSGAGAYRFQPFGTLS